MRRQLNWIEHLTTNQKVAGSTPARRAIRDVAQLGSVLDLGSRGRRFESCHPDHDGEVAQLARAIGSYPVGREFESHPRYHYYLRTRCILQETSRTLSSVGQSCRLITDWSKVRVLQGPLKRRNTQVVEGSGLENRQVEKSAPGFESQFLRHLNYVLRNNTSRGRAAWQLVGPITRRSLVQILPSQPLALQLSRQSKGLKILVSPVRFWLEPPEKPVEIQVFSLDI